MNATSKRRIFCQLKNIFQAQEYTCVATTLTLNRADHVLCGQHCLELTPYFTVLVSTLFLISVVFSLMSVCC